MPKPHAFLRLRVVPRAARERVSMHDDGTLSVHVTRPPVDGEANRAVLRLLARRLDLPPSAVAVVAGANARYKRVRVEGIDEAGLRRRLERWNDG